MDERFFHTGPHSGVIQRKGGGYYLDAQRKGEQGWDLGQRRGYHLASVCI